MSRNKSFSLFWFAEKFYDICYAEIRGLDACEFNIDSLP